MYEQLESCMLCPRKCGAQRLLGKRGVCGATDTIQVARAALHFWEEPCISGTQGSGTIFFAGCALKCIFCQNHAISRGRAGVAISQDRLAQIMLELQEQGANNINLVTPFHYAPYIKEAILQARAEGLHLPCVCNTGGYELASTVEYMQDVIDVWLTDFKYASSDLAKRFSAAPDYPERAAEALSAMVKSVRNKGGRKEDENGIMQQGIIVRHLVLPSHTQDSCAVLDKVFEIAGPSVDVSIMNQYTPNEAMLKRSDALSRPLNDTEYEKVLTYADDLGFERIWWQQGGTVSQSFVPAFDHTGVLAPGPSRP